MQEIVNAVSILGFPVFMCLLEFWFIVKKTDETNNIIENNTRAILLLTQQLERNDNK